MNVVGQVLTKFPAIGRARKPSRRPSFVLPSAAVDFIVLAVFLLSLALILPNVPFLP
jgi:hypothetical protein